MEQTPPFPSPEELKSKLADFMKSNFGDRVAFTTLTQPDTVETGNDDKSPPEEAKEFEFHFLPRDIKRVSNVSCRELYKLAWVVSSHHDAGRNADLSSR